jgi:glycerophosphoryl diester phosphodiesterase
MVAMHASASRPRVVSHRGATETNPEHTLLAYRTALETGVDGLECDVRLSADGHLVCVHDRTLDRVADHHGLVSTMTLAELDSLDLAASRFPWAELDDEAPDVEEAGRRVLTLRRLCETVRDYDRPVDLLIETKHPTRYAGLVERRLVELLGEFGWLGGGSPARVMSFSSVALTRVQRLAPDLELVLLFHRPYSWQMMTAALAPGWVAGPAIELLREHPRIGRRLRRAGRRLHVWTVNTDEDIDLCVDLGVEALITDAPARALARLRR